MTPALDSTSPSPSDPTYQGPQKKFSIRNGKISEFEPFADGLSIMSDTQTTKPKSFRTGDRSFPTTWPRSLQLGAAVAEARKDGRIALEESNDTDMANIIAGPNNRCAVVKVCLTPPNCTPNRARNQEPVAKAGPPP